MFDMGIGDLMNNAAALRETQDEKRTEAMLFALDVILNFSVDESHYSRHSKYIKVIQELLEEDFYIYLLDVDLDVIYRLVSE